MIPAAINARDESFKHHGESFASSPLPKVGTPIEDLIDNEIIVLKYLIEETISRGYYATTISNVTVGIIVPDSPIIKILHYPATYSLSWSTTNKLTELGYTITEYNQSQYIEWNTIN